MKCTRYECSQNDFERTCFINVICYCFFLCVCAFRNNICVRMRQCKCGSDGGSKRVLNNFSWIIITFNYLFINNLFSTLCCRLRLIVFDLNLVNIIFYFFCFGKMNACKRACKQINCQGNCMASLLVFSICSIDAVLLVLLTSYTHIHVHSKMEEGEKNEEWKK